MGLDHIKSMKREDFKNNDYIDRLVEELNATGANVVVGKLDQLMNWAAPIHCGHSVLEQVAVQSSLCVSEQHVMIWHASDLK